MALLDVLLGFLASLLVAYIIFSLGEKKKRYDEYPFLSGERLKVTKAVYSVKWMHYVFLLVAIDAAIAVVLVASPAIGDVAFIFLLIISLLLLPLTKRW